MAFSLTDAVMNNLRQSVSELSEVKTFLPANKDFWTFLDELQEKFDTGHTHTAGDGGKLDWDNVWNDAVHSHESNAEGGTLANAALQHSDANFTVSFHCSRQLTATVTGLFGFQMPFAATAVEVSAYARASGGTDPTLTIDVKEAGTTILTTPISVTAGANAVATPSDTSIADNAAITVDATIGGTSPTWDDVTVVITLKKELV